MKVKHLIPLAIFLVIAIFLGIGLTRDPRKLPSTFIDKPAPQFRVPQVVSADKTFSPQDMKGQVWMLNVYASWCVACRVEHPLLVEIAKANTVPLIGLNYKDKREDALKMLEQQGNPYTLSAYDLDGRWESTSACTACRRPSSSTRTASSATSRSARSRRKP